MEIIETEKTEEEAIVFYRSEKDPKFFTFPFVQFKLRSQVPVETIALVNSVWPLDAIMNMLLLPQ